MGKSMSTAKQINRTPVANVAKESIIQQKPNQQIARKVQPVPDEPNADYLKSVNTIDKSFNDRLKQVFVTSTHKNPSLDLPKDRSMPQDRNTPPVYFPHSQEVEVRKPNSLLVDDVKLMLVNYKENPQKWTTDYIAARFDISKEIAEKLVTNYSTLHTYFAEASSDSDKYLRREEPIKRIRPNTSLYETEEILTTGVEKKYKSKQEFEAEWSEWMEMQNKKNKKNKK